MVDPRAAFQHQRLLSLRSIRILFLHPARGFTDPLVVVLHEVSLDDPQLSYETLSYVWGSPTGSRPIICDGKPLLVTPNCESALRHLRKDSRHKILWVDAICIDQAAGEVSVSERNIQVALMGEVYQKAASTICWLGEGTEFTASVFSRLARIGEVRSKRELRKLIKFNQKLHETGALSNSSTCLDHILLHPWHSRIWTVQEVALSQNCLVVCGLAVLSWETYVSATKFLIFDQTIEELDIQAFSSYDSIGLRNTLRELVFEGGEVGPDIESQKDRRSAFLTSCLSQVRRLQATNPKDKIYGLYGIFYTVGLPLPTPSYEKSLSEVYEDATISIIVHSRSLAVICYAPSNNRSVELPSWVPDFQDDMVSFQLPRSGATEHSHICHTRIPELALGHGKIYLRGKMIGTVTHRPNCNFRRSGLPSSDYGDGLPVLTEEKYYFISDIQTLKKLIHTVMAFREWWRVVKTISAEMEVESVSDLFYTLLTFDNAFDSPISQDTFDIWLSVLQFPDTNIDLVDGQELVTLWKTADKKNETFWTEELTNCAIIAASLLSGFSSRLISAKLFELTGELSSNMSDRALIQIHDRSLGVETFGTTFHTVKNGDAIVLLEGAECPIALRKRRGGWELVGSAYVDGVMEGEAWSDEEGIVGELENFTLY